MILETHRCCVEGCPNLAAYEVHRFEFDPADGAASFALDDTCRYICVEHAIENERRASDDRKPWSSVSYPHTNRQHVPGVAVYLQLESAHTLAHAA
jgi:hypothetical protein